MLPKWQKHLPHKLHSQPRLPMETTTYGKAWRPFRKQNSGLCSTTSYSTVPITCTQTWIHRTQSLHYDKSLKCNSLRHIVITNFAATIYRLLCEILLQRSLTRTKRYREDCTDISLIYHIHEMFRWYISNKSWQISANAFFCRLSFALLLHSIVGCDFALTSYLYWLWYFCFLSILH